VERLRRVGCSSEVEKNRERGLREVALVEAGRKE
jgi:hypothetical protein